MEPTDVSESILMQHVIYGEFGEREVLQVAQARCLSPGKVKWSPECMAPV